MRSLLCSLILLCGLTINAQRAADEYVDVVYFVGGGSYEGTILEYEYGNKVIFISDSGDLKEFDWVDIKRVNFRLDKNRLQELTQDTRANRDEAPTPVGEIKPAFIPSRKFQHQLSGALGLGRNASTRFGFRGTVTSIGGSFAYHLIKSVGPIQAGLGLDVSLMSQTRGENVAAATLQLEYGFGRGKLRPFVRFETGPTYPFGSLNTEDEVSDRKITVLYHPSLGVEITPPEGQWGSLVFDLGYRFLDSRFTVTTFTLDVVERNIQYRRLVLRGGIRF